MLLSEGGEGKLGTNVNFLLEEFGIALNNGRSGTSLRLCVPLDMCSIRLSDKNGLLQVLPP